MNICKGVGGNLGGYKFSNISDLSLLVLQGSRIDDQRSDLPQGRQAPTVPDEDFFGLIQKVQSSRLEEQRTTLPNVPEGLPIPQPTPGKKKKK